MGVPPRIGPGLDPWLALRYRTVPHHICKTAVDPGRPIANLGARANCCLPRIGQMIMVRCCNSDHAVTSNVRPHAYDAVPYQRGLFVGSRRVQPVSEVCTFAHIYPLLVHGFTSVLPGCFTHIQAAAMTQPGQIILDISPTTWDFTCQYSTSTVGVQYRTVVGDGSSQVRTVRVRYLSPSKKRSSTSATSHFL